MTTETVLATTPAGTTATAGRPATATVAGVAQLVFGSFTSVAGVAFSVAEGGGWAYVAAPLFVVALAGWWVAGLGLLRGRVGGYRAGLVMLMAELAFGVYKIAWVHESAAYLFQSLTVLMLAAQLAPSTRRWATR